MRIIPKFGSGNLPDDFFGNFFLLFIVVENRRTVLRADIVTLAVKRGRVVDGEKYGQQVFIRQHQGVKCHLDNFSVTGIPVADLGITRVLDMSAGITGLDQFHSIQFIKYGFQAPETASRQISYLSRRNRDYLASYYP